MLAPLREAAGTPLMDGLRATLRRRRGAARRRRRGRRDAHRAVPRAARRGDRRRPSSADDGVAGFEFRHWGGAMARPGADAGPIGHRDVPFSVVAAGLAEEADDAARLTAGVRHRRGQAAPHATGGSFLNFLGDPARTPTAYTDGDTPAARGQGRVRPWQLVRGQPRHPAGRLVPSSVSTCDRRWSPAPADAAR